MPLRDTPPAARLLLASRSADKAREIREILEPVLPCGLITLDELGIETTADEEHLEAFETFRENALAKARHFARAARMPVIADDSGLVVDAIGGAPGVRSRRFSGRADLSGKALDDANNATLLSRLDGTPALRRTARYVCAAVLLIPKRPPLAAIGAVSGVILEQPVGIAGFGYDPLFYVPQLGLTFAQVGAAVKHRWSHRAAAFRALATCLSQSTFQG